jgi:hypothetical protein
MVLKLGRSGQQIRNAWKVLKCGTGEGWRRSVGIIYNKINIEYNSLFVGTRGLGGEGR